MTLRSAVLGYPRIGEKRELKKALEAYWRGEVSESELERTGRSIREKNWKDMKEAGIDVIPSNDFSLYDQVLDMTALLGAVPERFGRVSEKTDLKTYFAMARGNPAAPAMEMTKWFDTNYHYIVPEFKKGQRFRLGSEKVFLEFLEALKLGIRTRPALIGPVTYLLLGKSKEKNFKPMDLLEELLPVYLETLKELKKLGAQSVQIDEPMLVTDLDAAAKKAYQKAYRLFANEISGLPISLTTYFGTLGANLKLALSLPVSGIHVDLVRGSGELAKIVRLAPKELTLSLGIIDGRNVWKADLNAILRSVRSGIPRNDTRQYLVAPSCSLLHVPADLQMETEMDPEIKNWLSFSVQKLEELETIKKALLYGERAVSSELKKNKKAVLDRRRSARIHKKQVRAALSGIKSGDHKRKSSFKIRQLVQKKKWGLPDFPTTTIGSFPQTADVRKARADFKQGKIAKEKYNDFLKKNIREAIDRQVEIGLDVLVHGEAERNDMVEYFGERLSGFVFTKNGWVQSYGTRCVKPPIIYGDVHRPKPMTIEWSSYAQSLTQKPVKGMLTGPITILQWSFVRDDQPRSETAKQIALAIRKEVADLERAGIGIIQIDEPAIREGLPIRKAERKKYLLWAVNAFRLASCGVKDQTQIHTHMCYSEFNDIIRSIAAMDADVISIETARSQMELLDAFVKFKYPNEIGPGVYDIHSPRVPAVAEIQKLLRKASKRIPEKNLWVNPDCGLKTRGWEETHRSLQRMVSAAKSMRKLV